MMFLMSWLSSRAGSETRVLLSQLFDRSRLMSEVQISKITMNKLCTVNFCFVVG